MLGWRQEDLRSVSIGDAKSLPRVLLFFEWHLAWKAAHTHGEEKKEESSVTRKEGSGRRPEEATLDAELWFHDLIKNVGEQSPESDLVYLPPATKADFWREYQDDRKEQERIVSKTTFYNLWKTKFKHLKVVRRICLFLVDRD